MNDAIRYRIEPLTKMLLQKIFWARKIGRKRSWSMSQKALASVETNEQIRALIWSIEQAGQEVDDPEWVDTIPRALKRLGCDDDLLRDMLSVVKRIKDAHHD
jgi:hypothetical protein